MTEGQNSFRFCFFFHAALRGDEAPGAYLLTDTTLVRPVRGDNKLLARKKKLQRLKSSPPIDLHLFVNV